MPMPPIVVLTVESFARIGSAAGIAFSDLTETGLVPRPALAIRGRIFEIAVGHVIPRARVAGAKEAVVPISRGVGRLI